MSEKKNIVDFVPVETSRLIIRQFTLDDIDALAEIYGDSEVMQYIGHGALSREETEEHIRSAIDSWKQYGLGNLAVIRKSDNKLIGRCSLNFLDGTTAVHFGFVIHKLYWRQGFGAEVAHTTLKYGFETLKLPYIYGGARATNIGSIKVMKKLGMTYVPRDTSYYKQVAVFYGISQDEFINNATITISKESLF